MKHLIASLLLTFSALNLAADNYSEGVRLFEYARNNAQFSWAEDEFDKAFFYLTKAADEGFADAAYKAGLIKLYGWDGKGENIKEAAALISNAIENESELGRVELGDIYATSEFPEQNDTTAFNYWKQAYDYGEPEALSRLVAAYWFGVGTEQDKALASQLATGKYSNIAYSDYILSMVALAEILQDKTFCEQKYNESAIQEAASLYFYTQEPDLMLHGATLLAEHKIEAIRPVIRSYGGSWLYTNYIFDSVIRAETNTNDSIKSTAMLSYAKFNDKITIGNRNKHDNDLKYQYGYTSGDALLWAASYNIPEAIEMAALWYKLGLGLPKNLVKAKTYEDFLAENFPERVPAVIIDSIAAADNEIYDNPAIAARFPGHEDTLKQWLSTYLRTPNNSQGGTIKVGFIVEKDGSLSNIEILEAKGSDAMQTEALRITRTMPKFIPAKNENGIPVRSRSSYICKFYSVYG